MKSSRFKYMALIGVIGASLMLSQSVSATTITLKSGNGVVGGTDILITMLVGPANAPFGPLTTTEFTSASVGPAAFIVSPNASWKPHLTSDPSAEWISTTSTGASIGSTALYAIDFTIPDPTITTATLDFGFLVDNDLGDIVNEGLFINGSSIIGSKLLGAVPSHFQVDQSFATFDITALVTPGVNTLFMNAVNELAASGLQFSATVNVNVVPEPSTLLLLGSGLVGLAGWRWRQQRLTKAS